VSSTVARVVPRGVTTELFKTRRRGAGAQPDHRHRQRGRARFRLKGHRTRTADRVWRGEGRCATSILQLVANLNPPDRTEKIIAEPRHLRHVHSSSGSRTPS